MQTDIVNSGEEQEPPAKPRKRRRWFHGYMGIGVNMWPFTYFHLHGRDRSGAWKWEGETRALVWASRLMTVIGWALLAGIAAILATAQDREAVLPLGGATALMFTLAYGMRRLLARLVTLAPLEQTAERLGVSQTDLAQLAEERGIRPRIILNDVPLYEPAEFVDAERLLRPSEAPIGGDLLRPAGAVRGDEELLLHPADAPAPAYMTEEPVQHARLDQGQE
jgi:hypothetical protein